MKKVAVLQSNYIPWRGYFDIIHDVDEFIFYDEVQFTKNDWRNRNRVVAPQGTIWLSVPVGSKENRRILDVEIADRKWQKKHFQTLEMAYHRAPFFHNYEAFFWDVFMERTWTHLYQLNRFLIKHIAKDFLHISVKFSDSREYTTQGRKHEKLLSLLRSAGASVYVSGPAAKNYIVAADYERLGIELVWKDYGGYPAYRQCSQSFDPFVSIVDLLFCVGEDAAQYIWGWRNNMVLMSPPVDI